jgi:hypothetical protein
MPGSRPGKAEAGKNTRWQERDDYGDLIYRYLSLQVRLTRQQIDLWIAITHFFVV